MQITFDAFADLPHVKSGRSARARVGGAHAFHSARLPTIAEAGLTNIVPIVFGIFAPARTPTLSCAR